MFIIDEVTGNMTIRQGDTYMFTVEGVDDSYDLYYSVYDSNRKILWEIQTKPINQVASFNITPAYSTQLSVPTGRKTETYYYGLKRCKDGYEDTLIVGNKEVGDLNRILVYPLITEGDENGAS